MVLVAVGLVSIGFALFIGNQKMETSAEKTVLKNLRPVPDLFVEGWLNGDPPTPVSMKGKVVVIEAFATWCEPCRRYIPYLASLKRQFENQDVIFLSLTNEEGDIRDELAQFASQTGMDWRIGYGAESVMLELDAHSIPATYVVSRERQVVWTSEMPGNLEEAIKQALTFQTIPDAPAVPGDVGPVETSDAPQ